MRRMKSCNGHGYESKDDPFPSLIMGQWAVTHDPRDSSKYGDPFDPVTHFRLGDNG